MNLQAFVITYEALTNMLRDELAVPTEARLLAVHPDILRRSFVLVLEHPSYPATKEGCEPNEVAWPSLEGGLCPP